MPATITAFANSPDRGRGLARDMAVRWAFEEVGEPYDVRLLTFAELKRSAHLEKQPFGQIPTLEEGGLSMFESGAIVLHIAERHSLLLPADADARRRAISWIFAALTTVEAPIVEREAFIMAERDRAWFADRLPLIDARVSKRLSELSLYLDCKDWLENSFSAGDLLMVNVLRRLRGSPLLEQHKNLCCYISRAETRPAFQRGFRAQYEVFERSNVERGRAR